MSALETLIAELLEYADCEDHHAGTYSQPSHVKANIARNNAILMRKAARQIEALATALKRCDCLTSKLTFATTNSKAETLP